MQSMAIGAILRARCNLWIALSGRANPQPPTPLASGRESPPYRHCPECATRPSDLIFGKTGGSGRHEDVRGQAKTLGQKGTKPLVTFAVSCELTGVFGSRRLYRLERVRRGLAGPFDPRTVTAIFDHVSERGPAV